VVSAAETSTAAWSPRPSLKPFGAGKPSAAAKMEPCLEDGLGSGEIASKSLDAAVVAIVVGRANESLFVLSISLPTLLGEVEGQAFLTAAARVVSPTVSLVVELEELEGAVVG